MVQTEALQASMYDTVLSEHQKVQMAAVAATAAVAEEVKGVEGGGLATVTAVGPTKRVMFRETVDTAVVDLSLPPSNDAVMDSLFDDDYDLVDEDYLPHFDDGGIERDVKAIMRRSVELVMQEDEDEEVQLEDTRLEGDEYDSEAEDNNDWREGE
ncbi:hypothetical protein BC830DRAFT_1126566 [Chytriomyces sp. MP71]|nr:hypothetical protein BC830DRAFT_1126566 [Chytriomyces sp. MP71]